MTKKTLKKITIFSIIAALGICPMTFADTITDNSQTITANLPIDDYSLDTIKSILTPAIILETVSGFRIDQNITGVTDENLLNGVFYSCYVKDKDLIYFNQFADYPDGYYNHLYYSTDPEDAFLYVASTTGTGQQPASSEKLDNSINSSITEYESFEDINIISAEISDNLYLFTIECKKDGVLYFTDIISVDPSTGYAVSISSVYYDENENITDTILQTITYSDDMIIDSTPKSDFESEK